MIPQMRRRGLNLYPFILGLMKIMPRPPDCLAISGQINLDFVGVVLPSLHAVTLFGSYRFSGAGGIEGADGFDRAGRTEEDEGQCLLLGL